MEIAEVAEAIRDLRAGALPPEEFRRRRVVNGIYPIRGGADRYLLRVRIPLGRPSPSALETLADVADRFAPGRPVHLTTRQDVHIYGVQLGEIPEALAALAAGGLTTREACGDTVRNIVVCPFAGIARDEVFDVSPIAEEVGRRLLRNPLGQGLPRKFKIAFEGCASGDHVGLGCHDVGARAVLSPDGAPGFRLTLAGGLGALPRPGVDLEPFTPALRLGPTVEAVLRLFDRLGDRERRGRARLKFVAEALGASAFREAVLSERERVEHAAAGTHLHCRAVTVCPPASSEGESVASEWAGTFSQRQPGFVALPARVPLADLSSRQLRGLARLAVETGGSLRFTPGQGILLADVPAPRVGAAAAGLRQAGLFPPSAFALTRCAGADTCAIGTTRVRGLAASIEREFLSGRDVGASGRRAATIRISGCANGCGHHLAADIGLQGVSRTVGERSPGNAGRPAPHYALYLGGGTRGDGCLRFGTKVGRLPVRLVPEALRRILDLCRSEAADGESAGEVIARLGTPPFAAALAGLLDPPPETYSDEDYLDLGPSGPLPFPPNRSGPRAP